MRINFGMSLSRHILAFVAIIGLISGCGGGSSSKVKTVPVNGTVTLDDKPLAGATVRFFDTTGKNISVSGVTDDQGKYSLGVSDIKGAPPGNYNVVVSKLVDLMGNPIKLENGKDAVMAQMEGKAKELLHNNYSHMGMTQLKAEVKDGSKPIDFKLRTDGT